MFDHKLRTKGIIRTRFAELTALKGKKKSPNKRYYNRYTGSPNQHFAKLVNLIKNSRK
jgi:hypothetical protein